MELKERRKSVILMVLAYCSRQLFTEMRALGEDGLYECLVSYGDMVSVNHF